MERARATSSAPASRLSSAWMVVGLEAHWLALLVMAPLYLTYRTYKVYLGRIEDEQRHVARNGRPPPRDDRSAGARDRREGPDVAVAHPPRAAVRGRGARGAGHVRERHPGRQDRRAAARHRQARGARAHPVEAGAAHARGVPEDPRAPEGRRRHRQLRAVPVSGGAADPEPPRAVGRQGLSRGAQGRGDSARRAHPVGRRLLRRADGRAAVPQGDGIRAAIGAAAAGGRARARPDRGREVHRAAAEPPGRGGAARAGDAQAGSSGRRRRSASRPPD